MLVDISQYFAYTKSTLSSVLRQLQRNQTIWYSRYRTEFREQGLPFLSEYSANLFFAPRADGTLLCRQRPSNEESERHAEELLQLLEDEQQAKETVKKTQSRKSRHKLAKHERNIATQEAALREKEALETAAAIAQAAAAILRERIKVEKEFAQKAAARTEKHIREQEKVIEVEGNITRALTKLEVDVQLSQAAIVNSYFVTMRASLLLVEQEIADAVIMQYATNLIVRDMISVLEAEHVMNGMLRLELRDNLSYVLPGFAEREAQHEADLVKIAAQREADRVELEALRRTVREEKEARECVICFVNPKNVLLQPCMHMAICQQCYETDKTRPCPICRGAVSDGHVYYT